ncbi:hypothetical protein GF389_05890, partial [Candidatus Dojkabacteria bacterium]|nr:hypothetical protein [Candidatus Dojkabacteria bacterium]
IGYSLNIIVLFGLILVLGLFVDDAIVVVETIDYHKKQGKKHLEAIKEGINAVGVADVAGTLTTVLAFAPLLMISGILGEFISPIPTTVIIALVFSLLIALSIIPYLADLLIPDKNQNLVNSKLISNITGIVNYFSDLVIKAGNKVADLINFYLGKWYLLGVVLFVALILIGVGGYFAGLLKFSVFPPQKDSAGMMVTITYQNGTSVQEKEQIADRVEEVLSRDYADVIEKANYVFVGVNQFGVDLAQIDIPLVERSERERTSVEIADSLQKDLAMIEEARITATEYQTGAGSEEFSFKMQIYDEDSQILASSAEVFSGYIETIELDNDVEILETKVDYVGAIAKKDNRRYVEVAAKISDPTDSGALLEIEEKVLEKYDSNGLENLGLGEDSLGFDKGIESDNLEAFNSAAVALGVAILLMYVILVIQFDSFLQPLLIFLAFPFSFIGLFPGLYATDNAMSFFVMVGIIALVGIVVNNTIMLLDFIRQERDKGNDPRKSAVEAVRIRFRPLVTTSVTTVVGLLPLALTDPLWESLAFSIVFGLIASTTMVIFVFPAYYVALETGIQGTKNLFSRLSGKILG